MSEKFWGLVRQACQAESQYRHHMTETRMTAEAIIDRCLKRAGSSMERLNQLREILEERRTFMKHPHGFIFRVERWFQSGRICGGIPDSSSRMARPGRDEALVELGGQWSLYELWAVACQNAERKWPGGFGTIEDLTAWQKRAEELKRRRQALFARIGKEYAPDDLNIGGVRGDGSALVSFTLGGIPLAPIENAEERLITHLLREDPSWGDIEASGAHQPKRQKVVSG